MYEVGTALCPTALLRSLGLQKCARTQDLAGNMTSGRRFRKMSGQFNTFLPQKTPACVEAHRQQLETQYPPHLFCISFILIQKNHK
jgi:hypothetical protein